MKKGRMFTETFFRFFFGFAAILAVAFGVTIILSMFAPQQPEIDPSNLANPTVQG